MIQVRNVTDRLHGELLRRATSRGQTLTAYIEELLEREVARPPIEDVLERVRARPPVKLAEPVADAVKEERARRGTD
jgi:hypothetical protein